MIEIIDVREADSNENQYGDVNVDIHKEYNELVFKYAELLTKHLNLLKKYKATLESERDLLKQNIYLKEKFVNDRIKYSGVSEM